MKKIIVLTTCRDRDHYLEAYLNYLDIIAKGYDITVYIAGFNTDYPGERFQKYELNNINYYRIGTSTIDRQVFRKGQIYNYLIYFTRDIKCDYICFWDCDLLINKLVLEKIEKEKEKVFVLGGLKLNIESTEKVLKNNFDDPFKLSIEKKSFIENTKHFYIGNLCIPRKHFKIMQEVCGNDDLYNFNFQGFGGEDNVVYNLIKQISKKRFLSYEYISNAWRHMYHERQCDKDKEQYENNIKLMRRLIEENEEKVKSYGGE